MLPSHEGSLAAIDQYMQEVNWIAPLTDDEEARLLLCIQSGVDVQRSCERLSQGYQSMMLRLARRFIKHTRDLEVLDLVQEGNEAFLRALTQYDAQKYQASFRTFIFSWVRGAMLTAVWRYQGSLRFPLHKTRALKRMKDTHDALSLELLREPTMAETAAEMGVSEREVRELFALQEQVFVSIHASLEEDEDCTLEETIVDPHSSHDADENLHDMLVDALVMLPDRERLVVNLRYGVEDGQARTQKEVASLLGVSAARVAELDRRAQRRLRQLMCVA